MYDNVHQKSDNSVEMYIIVVQNACTYIYIPCMYMNLRQEYNPHYFVQEEQSVQLKQEQSHDQNY
jgi:hypothetical protein